MKINAMGRWLIFCGIAVVGFALDMATKSWAIHALTPGKPVSVIGGYLQFFLLFNRGGIFGIDPRAWIPGFPVNLFFYVFNSFAIILLIVYFHAVKKSGIVTTIGISLIMPGALGNLADRILHPARGVVDFIKMGISEQIYWPVYNMADMYITFGVILILLDVFREEIRAKSLKTGSDKQ